MPTKLLLPLLNQNVTTFKGPTWYLSENTSIETISTEDYGLVLSSSSAEYCSLLTPKSKCIRIEGVNVNECQNIANIEGIKIAFLLNYFKASKPIALSFAVLVTKTRKTHLDRIIDLSIIADARLQRKHSYRVLKDVARDTISQFYQVISKAYEKHPGILITFDRFNSALSRSNPFDKIIDITISLESLINGTTELRHKFALYNALAAEKIKGERKKML